MSLELAEPAETKEAEPPKNKGGRPPKAKEETPPETLAPIKKKEKDRHLWARHLDAIGVGSTVIWHEGGDLTQPALAALVVRKYPDSATLDLMIFDKERAVAYATREGVRHADDPAANNYQRADMGVWLPGTETLKLMELEARLKALEQ